ncbi:HD-like signal output (HDOD) domain, no enzymatic activity [Malonomonas rubra DSM 5091]|uniref:HD-like signal output (HDOD) domain, no enzymatic activity n=1 Tax=Malonomonas rubra DSM 5091 TaxID=1122189 RepID=A0A1M6BTV7_MALRU|nr:HDOD domain-containing protein [Malonomonas rubra]SHI52121.1 HD-like signal output (HDOD) domain, no enzymatic activity [Malonomonas rubra DSM 5091]
MMPDEIIKDIKQLVSLPDVVLRANQLIDSPEADASAIGEVIGHDPALSAQLLKLVNSAFYNFPGQIETVSRAITLVGLNELRSLIFASKATQTFQQLAPEKIDMDVFWLRSVYCGIVAKKLASVLLEENGEAMFLTGLLHNIGTLILFSRLPEQAQLIVDQADQSGRSLAEVEKEVLGFDSAQLGSTLLESWRLPKKLWEPVRFQYHPEITATYQTETEILKLARQITDCVEPELKTGQPLELKKLQATAVNGVEPTTEQLEMIVTDANLESFDVLAIINPKATMIF